MTNSPVPQPERPALRVTPLSGWTLAVVVVVIVLVTGALVTLLWLTLAVDPADPAQAGTQLEVLRIGATVALGGGGGIALFLAWRRQRSTEIGLLQKERDQADVARAYELQRESFDTTRVHQQRVAESTERDAEARRITDLNTKAVEQLGSEKAPVRLGGLYALERLAQDHAEQRQTIINVLCAYLRMPYTLPGDPPANDVDADKRAEYRDLVQEREVRLAAQRILAHHLRPGEDPANPIETFWANLDLDLAGATLIDFTLDDCVIRTMRFDGAQFTGETRFARTTVTDRAEFRNTTLTGRAEFRDTTFTGEARFDNATFTGRSSFYRTRFTGNTRFDAATFHGEARFDSARFADEVWFSATTFTGEARFSAATFARRAGFGTVYLASDGDGTQIQAATFASTAWFDVATFTLNAWFGGTRFTGKACFSGANFPGDAGFTHATFTADAQFNDATFNGRTDFDEVTFNSGAQFDGASLPSNRYVEHRTRAPWTNFIGARFARSVPTEVAGFVSMPPDD